MRKVVLERDCLHSRDSLQRAGGVRHPGGRLFFGVEVHWERGFRENECVIRPVHVLGTCRRSPEGPTELVMMRP